MTNFSQKQFTRTLVIISLLAALVGSALIAQTLVVETPLEAPLPEQEPVPIIAVPIDEFPSPDQPTSSAHVLPPRIGPQAPDGLTIHKQTPEEFTGSFEHQALTVTFTSRVEATGRILSQLAAGRLVLDFTFDPQAGTLRWDGHGNIITHEHREALLAFLAQLENYLRPYDSRLPEHEELLFRFVNYMSEAPVDFPIPGWETHVPSSAAPPESLIVSDAQAEFCKGGTREVPFSGNSQEKVPSPEYALEPKSHSRDCTSCSLAYGKHPIF